MKTWNEPEMPDAPLGFSLGGKISIFVCYGSEKERSNKETAEFLRRTGKHRDFDIADLVAPDSSGSVFPSFSQFISCAPIRETNDHMFFISSSFRISMQSLTLLQHAHMTQHVHISTPRVESTRALSLPQIDLRELYRRMSTQLGQYRPDNFESRPLRSGRCEAIFLLRKDIPEILDGVAFVMRSPQKSYVKGTGTCRLQQVVDAVAFN